MFPSEACNYKCIKKYGMSIEDIIETAKQSSSTELRLPWKQNDYYLCYALVGNYATDPYVIISGKTTSGDSSDNFANILLNHKDETFYSACVKSIYSNMKDNLFRYLNRIDLFGLLKKYSSYWKTSNYEDQWNKMFTSPDESKHSGIQITQAFNCAILHEKSSKRSSQPPNRIFETIKKDIGCMFEHFRISRNLRLIIFLDTPNNDTSFHQIHFWERYCQNLVTESVKIISITHPSAQNSIVYRNLDKLQNIRNKKAKNALALLDNAKRTILELHNAIY